MPEQALIRVGSRVFATLALVQGNTHGTGGSQDPHLGLTFHITIAPLPLEAMNVLTALTVTLGTAAPSGGTDPLLPPVTLRLLDQFRYRSLPRNPHTDQIALRLRGTSAQFLQMEAARATQPDGQARFTLSFQAEIAWLAATLNERMTAAATPVPFEASDGLLSSLSYFGITSVEDLDLVLPASTWIERVLPGLGVDRLHLIEVALPEVQTLVPAAAVTAFGQARRQFQLGLYPESIALCRNVRTYVERHLEASGARPIGRQVAARLGWPAGTAQEQLIQEQFQTLLLLTNAAHHVDHGRGLTAADARTGLILTATWLQYLGALAPSMMPGR